MSRGRRAALTFGLLKLAIHLVTLTPYGFFRDELYYIACAEHPALGYVDQPPFSIGVLAIWRAAFGDSLASVRTIPALAAAVVVLVTGLLAIELGGGALAVSLASLGVIASGQALGTAHYFSMNVLDQLFWVLGAFFTVRSLRDPRFWPVLGAVLGLGLLNKISILWLGAGLAVGLVVTSRHVFLTRGPYVAGVIALVLFAPFVIWQAQHDWPMREFMHNAMAHKYVERSFGSFVSQQVLQVGPFALPLWLSGLYALVRGRLGKANATLGWIYLVTFAIVAAQKTSKPEYMTPSYPMVMAAGGVFLERSRLPRVALDVFAVVLVASFALVAPFALAILSEEQFAAYTRRLGIEQPSTERRATNEIGQFYADMHGWRELGDEVARIWDTLTVAEQEHATVWARTGGYGPAAAIDYFTRGRGLPPTVSTHNNYWLWGPGAGDGSVVIVVGGSPSIARDFESLEQVTTFECGYCRPDENHKPIYVGRHMKPTLAETWADEKSFE